MERTRAGTAEVLQPISDDELAAQISPLGAAARLESRARRATSRSSGCSATSAALPRSRTRTDDVYEALRRARRNGARLPALRAEPVRAYAADVRERALDLLEHIDLDSPDALVRRGYAFGLVVQNELAVPGGDARGAAAPLRTLVSGAVDDQPGSGAVRPRGDPRRRGLVHCSAPNTSPGRTTTSSRRTRSRSSRSSSTERR